MIEQYLQEEQMLRGVVHLVDARHDPTMMDQQMISFLATLNLPTLVVLTKIDKLKKTQRANVITTAIDDLGLDEDQLLLFSSKTGEGRNELLDALEVLVGSKDSYSSSG